MITVLTLISHKKDFSLMMSILLSDQSGKGLRHKENELKGKCEQKKLVHIFPLPALVHQNYKTWIWSHPDLNL